MSLSQKQTQLKRLQTHWYKKLKRAGFEDIETAHDTLETWDSFYFAREKVQATMSKKQDYLSLADAFTSSEDFEGVIALMNKHGNNKLSEKKMRAVWDLHRNGLSTWTIAKQMKVSQSCIFFMIKRFQSWMTLTV